MKEVLPMRQIEHFNMSRPNLLSYVHICDLWGAVVINGSDHWVLLQPNQVNKLKWIHGHGSCTQ